MCFNHKYIFIFKINSKYYYNIHISHDVLRPVLPIANIQSAIIIICIWMYFSFSVTLQLQYQNTTKNVYNINTIYMGSFLYKKTIYIWSAPKRLIKNTKKILLPIDMYRNKKNPKKITSLFRCFWTLYVYIKRT